MASIDLESTQVLYLSQTKSASVNCDDKLTCRSTNTRQVTLVNTNREIKTAEFYLALKFVHSNVCTQVMMINCHQQDKGLLI